MNKILIFLLLLVFLTTTQLQAVAINVPADTKVSINLEEQYTSEQINSDKIIPAVVSEDVILNNKVIFKKGDKANIMVSAYKKKRFFGRGGYIEIQDVIIKDTQNNEHVFSLSKRIEGGNREWVLVCITCGMLIILAPLVLCGFVKGKSAIITENTTFYTYLKNSFTY